MFVSAFVFVGCNKESDEPNSEILPTKVTIKETNVTLEVDDTISLTATVEPSNATNQTVIWSTSNANVARVAFGQVSAMGPGSATITVKTEDGNKTDTCLVTVTGEVVKVRAFSIAPTSATIYVGETVTLEPSFLPANPTNKTVFWSSDKPNIASVNDGVVTGVEAKKLNPHLSLQIDGGINFDYVKKYINQID